MAFFSPGGLDVFSSPSPPSPSSPSVCATKSEALTLNVSSWSLNLMLSAGMNPARYWLMPLRTRERDVTTPYAPGAP